MRATSEHCGRCGAACPPPCGLVVDRQSRAHGLGFNRTYLNSLPLPQTTADIAYAASPGLAGLGLGLEVNPRAVCDMRAEGGCRGSWSWAGRWSSFIVHVSSISAPAAGPSPPPKSRQRASPECTPPSWDQPRPQSPPWGGAFCFAAPRHNTTGARGHRRAQREVLWWLGWWLSALNIAAALVRGRPRAALPDLVLVLGPVVFCCFALPQ